MKIIASLVVIVGLWCMYGSTLSAHEIGYTAIYSTLTQEEDRFVFHTQIPLAFTIDEAVFGNADVWLTQYLSQFFSVTHKGTLCPLTIERHTTSNATETDMFGSVVCDERIESLNEVAFHNALFADLFHDYDNHLTVTTDREEKVFVFTPEVQDYPQSESGVMANTSSNTPDFSKESYTDEMVTVETGVASPVVHTDPVYREVLLRALQYIVHGGMYVGTGYIHILFLGALVLLVRPIKRIVLLVGVYTGVYALTIVALSFSDMSLSPMVSNAILGLTLVYVGIQNIYALRTRTQGDAYKIGGWQVVALLGLLHGIARADVYGTDPFFAVVLYVFGIVCAHSIILVAIIPFLFTLDTTARMRQMYFGVSFISVFWGIWYLGTTIL